MLLGARGRSDYEGSTSRDFIQQENPNPDMDPFDDPQQPRGIVLAFLTFSVYNSAHWYIIKGHTYKRTLVRFSVSLNFSALDAL